MQQMAKDDETLSEVNVIPLADLSLVLLIILMVLSPLVSQGLISLAKAQAQAAETSQDMTQPETPVIVSLEPGAPTPGGCRGSPYGSPGSCPGALRLNGAMTTTDMEFINQLEVLLMKRKDKAVNLTASPYCLHGDVVRVMDLIQRHGASNLVMLKWDASANQPAAIAATYDKRHQGARS